MSKQNQSRNKKWCKYCNQYYYNSYFEAHLETKMHKENILSNQIHKEPIYQQIPQKDFIMNSNHLIKYNIENILQKCNYLQDFFNAYCSTTSSMDGISAKPIDFSSS